MDRAAIPDRLDELLRVRVMDVEYVHVRLASGDDLYVTGYGLPVIDLLLPENYWTDKGWFRANSQRLSGSSTLYRIRTKEVSGRWRDVVLKWNRMGQDVPGATRADDLATAEFNSPFEEFSLALELRLAGGGRSGRVLTHRPLAIYVPARRVRLERLGRRLYKIEAKRDAHAEIELDPHRMYAVIYEWVKGIDTVEARNAGLIDTEAMVGLVERCRDDMRRNGFVVRDNKPEHVIVRPDGTGGLLRDRRGKLVYAMIDFELLERAPERERAVRAAKRKAYLFKQAHRFESGRAFPPHLHPVSVLGVDYVYGRIESTGGALWVVGQDPDLFDYFLPEKWRKTPRTKLSNVNEVYETITKDNIHLVWRVSKIGELPDMDPFKPDEQRIIGHGYNSPFEEIALAMKLTAGGIETIYPRAVYMTGEASNVSPGLADDRRYEKHADLRMPDGQHTLQPNRDYILIWGYWNAPDELLAERDEDLYTGINALDAYRRGLLSDQHYLQLMHTMGQRLEAVDIEDLSLRGNHLLLSLDRHGKLVLAADDLPAVRVCSFELLRRVDHRS